MSDNVGVETVVGASVLFVAKVGEVEGAKEKLLVGEADDEGGIVGRELGTNVGARDGHGVRYVGESVPVGLGVG